MGFYKKILVHSFLNGDQKTCIEQFQNKGKTQYSVAKSVQVCSHPLFPRTLLVCGHVLVRNDSSMRAVGTQRKPTDAVKNGAETTLGETNKPTCRIRKLGTAPFCDIKPAVPRDRRHTLLIQPLCIMNTVGKLQQLNCEPVSYTHLDVYKRQPMDQGVIASFKRRYRRKLSEILGKMEDENSGLVDSVKTINIKDVVYMICLLYTSC